jgi:PAS domain S-box-containing protein
MEHPMKKDIGKKDAGMGTLGDTERPRHEDPEKPAISDPHPSSGPPVPASSLSPEARLAEAEETLRAIYEGEVDALVVHRPEGEQIYTLKGAETPYRLLLEAMNEGAITLSQDGTILYCNSRFAQMAGRPMEQVIGCTCQPCFSADEYTAFQDLLKKAEEDGVQGTFTLQTAQGAGLSVKVSVRPFRLDEADGFSVLVTDISELKRSEKALRESNEKLRELVGELEHFSYTITHDMRAPLRAMQGFGDILMDECGECLHGERRDFIRRIVESAARMDSLITDALDYSKIVRQELELTPVNATALLRGMVGSYPQFQPPKAEVRVEGYIPLLLANKAGLTQCFSNLLGNAVKFAHPDRPPKVRVWAEPREDSVRLWFEDNGIGIAKEHHHRIFLMFQRLSRSYEGTGIGLALVRKTVERMKGRVGLESEPGQGSRFWIELKRAGN